MKLPFGKTKRIDLTPNQKKRIVNRANRRTKFLPGEWRTRAFHKEAIRLTQRKKARIALRGAKILSISTRRSVFRMVDEYTAKKEELGEEYHGLKYENELSHAKNLFRKQIEEVVGKKSTKFLEIFFSVHG